MGLTRRRLLTGTAALPLPFTAWARLLSSITVAAPAPPADPLDKPGPRRRKCGCDAVLP